MIRCKGLVYTVGTFRLEVSFEIAAGEYFVLMGPTGSGKTATVECIAGLRVPQSGHIEIHGRDITYEEPRRRMVGYVPQDYALFLHRTVRRNIAFGPEVRGWPRTEIEKRVRETAGLLGIESLLDRPIAGLSGGERQRVALARALAMNPQVLILDEPVSALDEYTRDAVCRELVRIQRTAGIPVIHVCHSFEEASLVADRIGVMCQGHLLQVATPRELYAKPVNRLVAEFLRVGNVFSGEARPNAGGGQ
ncbi:MAG: ATP-binding cassette domain-containing protein [Kiritimatiellae bacterium]|nr:ATP-binding cassette domain-containing protein [Kiritimatiellia bacterium]